MHDLTPFILLGLSLLAGWAAWLSKRVISHGELLAVVKFYFESKGVAAAAVLNSDNPTPPEIRRLLTRIEKRETLARSEMDKVETFLRTLAIDPEADRTEKAAALEFLLSMTSLSMIERLKRKQSFFRRFTSVFRSGASVLL